MICHGEISAIFITLLFIYNPLPHEFQLSMSLREEAFIKHCNKRRKSWLSAFYPFLSFQSKFHNLGKII